MSVAGCNCNCNTGSADLYYFYCMVDLYTLAFAHSCVCYSFDIDFDFVDYHFDNTGGNFDSLVSFVVVVDFFVVLHYGLVVQVCCCGC